MFGQNQDCIRSRYAVMHAVGEANLGIHLPYPPHRRQALEYDTDLIFVRMPVVF